MQREFGVRNSYFVLYLRTMLRFKERGLTSSHGRRMFILLISIKEEDFLVLHRIENVDDDQVTHDFSAGRSDWSIDFKG